jgi:hypothetical protein
MPADLRDWILNNNNNHNKYTTFSGGAQDNHNPKDFNNFNDYQTYIEVKGYRKVKWPKKPIYKAPEPVKKETPKPNPPVINKPPVVNPPVNDNPVVIPPKKVEPLNTKFSATFGQDGKQETRYFKNFDEWNRFYESVKGKFGFMNGNHNKSKTEASMLLKGIPSDWGL